MLNHWLAVSYTARMVSKKAGCRDRRFRILPCHIVLQDAQLCDAQGISLMHKGHGCVLKQNAGSGTIRQTKRSKFAFQRMFVPYTLWSDFICLQLARKRAVAVAVLIVQWPFLSCTQFRYFWNSSYPTCIFHATS